MRELRTLSGMPSDGLARFQFLEVPYAGWSKGPSEGS